MTIRCIISPAGSGKTEWVANQARKAAEGLLRGSPRIVVPSRLLIENMQSRLAARGGALGVQVITLGDLAKQVLKAAGIYPVVLSEIAQRKLLQELLSGMDLEYFQDIKCKSGFIQICVGVIREMKSGGIAPADYIAAVEGIRGGKRLQELGTIYGAYFQALVENNWADSAGSVWMAARVLSERPDLCRDWGPVFIDGFDDLSPVQFRLVSGLSRQVSGCVFTLTGSDSEHPRMLVHKRFAHLRTVLETEGVIPEYLEELESGYNKEPGAVQALEAALFEPVQETAIPIGDEIKMTAVPDREAEVRTALRWIRMAILDHGLKPEETALMMRSLEPYRSLIYRISREYEIPVHLQGGVPLIENPAIAAVWRLIQLAREGRQGLGWQAVVSTWRSPYFQWENISLPVDGHYDRYHHLAETRQLEETARWGRVIQGYSQWEEAFHLLMMQEEDESGGLPLGEQATLLWEKFKRFVDLLDPPHQKERTSVHVSWVENLLGDLDPDGYYGPGIIRNILAGPDDLVERDINAVKRLSEIFAELVFADQLLDGIPVSFGSFADELEGVLKETSYQPHSSRSGGVLCSDCTEARGLAFKAVALLGLAEGEFPGTIREDPFLRDSDRKRLQESQGLPIRLSVDSAEAEYFYEAITRSSRWLLLTRPRIADNGTPWQSSPYWEEIERLTGIEPLTLTTRSTIPLEQAATRTEQLEVFASQALLPVGPSASNLDDGIRRAVEASEIIRLRVEGTGSQPGKFAGNLSHLGGMLSIRFSQDYVWSPSRLENYQTCPFNFYIGHLLGLEKKELPEEGLDARQRGNIYHHILENLYNAVGEDYQIVDLLNLLPEVAEAVFKDAPREEGFRETSWWEQTKREILEKLRLSLVGLERLEPDFRFLGAELKFGISSKSKTYLEVEIPAEGRYLVRGYIDRVDISSAGNLRIIDYKTSGKTGFDQRAVREGKKLQLPFYALAAEKALKLGKVQEGFYFHVLSAQPSSLRLATFAERDMKGPRAAMEVAARQGWAAVTAIRGGKFSPSPPDNGCPSYCPAIGFCWAYQSGNW